MKSLDAIAMLALVLTAVVSLCAVNAAEEPKAPAYEATTAPSTEEVPEPTQEPTETTQPDTEATVPPETTQPATEESLATEPPVILYAVPLAEDLQLHIIAQAESYGIDPAIVMAVIWKESRYNTWSGGDGGESLGLMQIQPKWHQWRMDALGCPDLFDPFQNVTVGLHILGEKFQKYGNIEMALMAYNAGDTGANRNWFSKGIYTNKYSNAVLEKAEELRGESYAFFR